MLDVSKVTRRKTWRLPGTVKAFFMGLALLPVCYGAFILLDYMAFYNNSVQGKAVVVNIEPSRIAMPRRVSEGVAAGDFGPNELFFIPGFFYTHENGQSYVGGAMTDATRWRYKPGQVVDIRYNRAKPEVAQPVTLLKFWAVPALYIGGGLIVFIGLGIAFIMAEMERSWERPIKIRRAHRLNLFRR